MFKKNIIVSSAILFFIACGEKDALKTDMIKYCEIQFVLKPFCKCLVDEKMARMSIDELNKARKSKNISYEAKRLFDKYGMRDEELYKCTKNIKGFS